MYKSPIEILTTDIQIVKQQEEEIYQAVVNVGIIVDKDELVRALKYDRQQHDIGYMEGKRDAMEEIVHCQDCYFYCAETNDRPLCGSWGSWCDPDGWCYRGERREGE